MKTPSTRSSPSPVLARQWTSVARQVDARPGPERSLLAPDLEHALALEHVDHLVVAVEVVGRAPGRDHAR